MSVTPDDVIQYNTGTLGTGTVTCSLPLGTTAGNTVFLLVVRTSDSPTAAGFTRDGGITASAVKAYVLRKAAVAGETSWNLVGTATQPTVWFAMEIQGIHVLAPRDTGVNSPGAGTGVTSQTTNTTAKTTAYSGMGLALWGAHNPTNTTVPVMSAFTNGVVEYAQNSRTDGSTATALCVGFVPMYDVGTFESTATISVSSNTNATLQCYAAADSKRVPNPDIVFGAEIGTSAGLTTGNAGNAPMDFATNATIVSTSARTGTYSLQLAGTAAAANAGWNSAGALVNYTAPTGGASDRCYYMIRFSFMFPGSLPGSDVCVAAMDEGTEGNSNGGFLFYRTGTQKLGVYLRRQIAGNGTEVLSDITLAADTWYDIDFYVDLDAGVGGTLWFGYWQLNAVEQTTATVAVAGSFAQITQARLGWQTATTATIRYDDIVTSKHPGHYPLGALKVYPLKVDPAATPTVTAATAFSTFTNNGTINSTFSTTTARDAVDDLPPTIGGTADGFVQDAIGASDYVELAMETRDGVANREVIRGVRWYFCGWAVTNVAATIGFRAYDGTTETTLFAAADPNFDSSTTTPAWVCKMHRTQASSTPFVWTQTQLDALAARVGFSGDADPDIGVHGIYAEVAMLPATELQVVQITVEGEELFVHTIHDPDSANCVALKLTASPTYDATATYTINGTPVTRTAVYNTPDVYAVNAATNNVVSSITADFIP